MTKPENSEGQFIQIPKVQLMNLASLAAGEQLELERLISGAPSVDSMDRTRHLRSRVGAFQQVFDTLGLTDHLTSAREALVQNPLPPEV